METAKSLHSVDYTAWSRLGPIVDCSTAQIRMRRALGLSLWVAHG